MFKRKGKKKSQFLSQFCQSLAGYILETHINFSKPHLHHLEMKKKISISQGYLGYNEMI